MSKEFKLGDRVTHDFSKTVGRVVGLRKAEPYTVKVKWEDGAHIEKDWYNPDVLKPYDESKAVFKTFNVDEANSDDEHFYLDILGKGTVMVVSNSTGVSVDIFRGGTVGELNEADNPIASMYVLNEDFEEEDDQAS